MTNFVPGYNYLAFDIIGAVFLVNLGLRLSILRFRVIR